MPRRAFSFRLFSVLFAACFACGVVRAEPVTVTLDPSEEHQTIHGFGASGAWWVTWFGELPAEAQERCLELLYGRRGAGLEIYRYNIPAGGGDEIRRESRRTPKIENEQGKIDITRDEAGLAVAKAVRELGVEKFVAFSNSPPERLTVSGMTSGGPEGGPNLKPGAESEFAAYAVEAAEQLRNELGLETIRLSPINEPQWDWGGPRRHQEGCHYKPDQVVAVIRETINEINRRGLPITVEAPESGSWEASPAYAEALFDDPVIREHLGAFAVHSYWTDEPKKRAFRAWMDERLPEIELAMTEYCEMRGDRDLGMRSGLHVAGVIHDDMTIGDVTEWQWWLGLAGGNFCDGLVDITPRRPEPVATKRLWAIAHWSRFVEPGSVRIGADSASEDLEVSAYRLVPNEWRRRRGDDETRYAVVVVNQTEHTHRLRLAGTDEGEHWIASASFVTDDDRDMAWGPIGEIPARSITTLIATEARPGDVWPDTEGVHINAHGGGILYHDGLYHWYGEHKGGSNAARVGVRVYTSPDLSNWTNKGVALAVSDDPMSEIRDGCVLERPKVIYNESTGKFVMWFHLELAGHGYHAARAGVAVSDSPTGPFEYLGSVRPNPGRYPMGISDELRERVRERDFDEPRPEEDWWAGEIVTARNFFVRQFYGGQMSRDQTLFVDDDGTAYHVYSSESNRTMHVAELDETYTKHTGRYVRLTEGMSREAPVMFKRDGLYHLITSGCTGWDPNPAQHAVAESIWGPWRVLGNPCVGEGAEITFGGQGAHVIRVRDADGNPTDEWIFTADRWRPRNPITGTYLWLPIEFDGERAILRGPEENTGGFPGDLAP